MPLLYDYKNDNHGNKYIALTGYDGEISALIIPEEIDGLPIKEVCASAFSGRRGIVEVKLPDTIEILGRYAFYNCTGLKKIQLYDGVEDYYDGVIKQCRNLEEISIVFRNDNYSVMRDMLRDNDRKLRFNLQLKNGERFSLTFPAYVYDFVEDVEARVLHHKIEGAGYPYRECVTRKNIDLLTYDRLFKNVISDSTDTAAEIALDRLMYPYNLKDEFSQEYNGYVLRKSEEILGYFLREKTKGSLDRRTTEIIDYMCKNRLITKEAVEMAIKITSEDGLTESCALFMNYQKENYGMLIENTSNDLALEDW